MQISVSQWYQDYPAASDFLNVLFGCDSFREGSDSSINISGFCDKDDQRADAGGAAAGRDRPGRRQQALGRDRQERHRHGAGRGLMFTPKHLDFVSKRLGNFQFNSQFYWMIAQSWVK